MFKRVAVCRGDGFVSLRYAPAMGDRALTDMNARVLLSDGRTLPSCTRVFQGKDGVSFLVVFPNMKTSRYELVLTWIDASGSEKAYKDSISPFRVKWESRIRYRLDEQGAYEIRPYADQVYRRGTNVLVSSVVPSGEVNTLHCEIRSLSCSAPHLRVYDESFREVGVDPIAMGAETLDSLGHTVWLTQFSCKVPASVKGACCCAYDEQGELLSFGGLADINELIAAHRVKTQTAWDCMLYEKWYGKHRVPEGFLEHLGKGISAVEKPVRFVFVILGNGDGAALKRTLCSIHEQAYGGYSVVVAASAADPYEQDQTLLDCIFVAMDELASHLEAIGSRNFDYVCFGQEGSTFEPDLLALCAERIKSDSSAAMIYFDEDVTLADGRTYPLFKPDFDPEMLHCRNYIGDFIVVRLADHLRAVLSAVPDAKALCYRLALSFERFGGNVVHIPRIGKHSFLPESDCAGYVSSQVSADVVRSHIADMGYQAMVSEIAAPLMTRVVFEAPSPEPLVSIIIPTKDNVDILATCVDSILSMTDYDRYEILIVENNSELAETFSYYESLIHDERGNVRVIEWPHEFNFSKIINFGGQHARGDYFVFLNNDTELIHGDWLRILVGSVSREGVGAVGVKLLYPDDTVQHAGVKIGDQGALHLNYGLYKDDAGYYDLACLAQNLSAVTAACMITPKTAFDRVGGFTEELAVAYNDVDFCLKLREAGFSIVYEPAVTLYHYESLTRGSDAYGSKGARLITESAYMLSRWSEYYSGGDPFYNKNLQGAYYGL